MGPGPYINRGFVIIYYQSYQLPLTLLRKVKHGGLTEHLTYSKNIMIIYANYGGKMSIVTCLWVCYVLLLTWGSSSYLSMWTFTLNTCILHFWGESGVEVARPGRAFVCTSGLVLFHVLYFGIFALRTHLKTKWLILRVNILITYLSKCDAWTGVRHFKLRCVTLYLVQYKNDWN